MTLRIALALALSACSSSRTLTRAELLDPETCKSCHPTHYAEWSGSMHAYAAEDPVFVAMNARAQREGALGDLCVRCHAPMALRDGLTKDGTNLASLPRAYRGVTCFFCHTVGAVTGTHNAALESASDLVMRGSYRDPISNSAHASAYAPTHDRDRAESSALCGACHDVVTARGAHVERTFLEWKQSVFSSPSGASCGQCHMERTTSEVPIATGGPKRRIHGHTQAGVDLALTEFPQREEQKRKVTELLASTLQTALCVKQAGDEAVIRVLVDNLAAGHSFPSGAGQDRRLWFEVLAEQNGQKIYESGASDPDRWLVRDCVFDAQQRETHSFWEAASFESNLLPAHVTLDPRDPRKYESHVYRSFPWSGTLPGAPDRVTLRVRLQPIGTDILDDLVKSGDLDPSVRASMPTLEVGAPLEWTPARATLRFFDVDNLPFRCVTDTSFDVSGDKSPAPTRARCAP